ncbi:hypothetical protein ADP8_05196 (plasmid) [Roseomonas mucosa]|nr:hypothetical protein ADP8_05196 [Roseomonas mucosa]
MLPELPAHAIAPLREGLLDRAMGKVRAMNPGILELREAGRDHAFEDGPRPECRRVGEARQAGGGFRGARLQTPEESWR